MASEVGAYKLFSDLELPKLACDKIFEGVPFDVEYRAVSKNWLTFLDSPSFVSSLLEREILPIDRAIRAGRDVPPIYLKRLNLKRMSINDQQLGIYCRKYPDVESLNLNGCDQLSAEGLKQIEQLGKLQHLSLLGLCPDPIWLSTLKVSSIALGDHDEVKDAHIAAIFHRIGEYNKIILRNLKVKSFDFLCPKNVQYLDVRGSPIHLRLCDVAVQTLKCSQLPQPPSNFHGLTSLNLTNVRISNLDFLSDSPHIKKLSVANSGLVPEAFGNILGRLTSLNVIGCSVGVDNFEKMKNLQKLKVSHVSHEEMDALTKTALKLKYIYVDQGQFSNESLKCLFELKKIKTVILMNCYGLREVDGLPKNEDVHELGFDGCSEFGDSQLETILKSFNHLFYLSLLGTGVSKEGLEKAQALLAKLSSLSIPAGIEQIPPSLAWCTRGNRSL